jgi:hypothetical protein
VSGFLDCANSENEVGKVPTMYKVSRGTRALFRLLDARFLGLMLLTAILAIRTGAPVRAAVTAIDDVIPSDNPFTEPLEGLAEFPTGNGININDPVNAQTRWERNEQIIVGVNLSMGGRLDIDSNSKLRYTDLIIGSRDEDDPDGPKGIGRVLITGLQSLYSNNPASIPPGFPSNFGSASQYARPTDVGFDLIIGQYGIGSMEIRAGGRADIQDAVIIGDQPGSSGSLIVDGFASLLASGGFAAQALDTEPHAMTVGRRGYGEMIIQNAAIVVSEAPPTVAASQTANVGAVIGSNVFDDDIPEAGGDGTVTVDGPGSKWIIGGSLQLGGFHDSLAGALPDDFGINVVYIDEAGSGNLYVQNDGLVQLRAALGADSTEDDLWLAIGRFGRLVLDGGTVVIGEGTTDADGTGREDNIALINDGVISGSGRITTGVFRNRYVGEVRVDPGQSLFIHASAEVLTAGQFIPPQVNYGVMRVLGDAEDFAQLEFERGLDAQQNPVQPFQNLRVPRPTGAPLADFYGGLISAQHSRLIFRSGIENGGMIAFTAGLNYVVGNVLNLPAPMGMPTDFGIIRVWGPGTRTIFENDLANLGQLSILGGATIDILERHSFITAGELMVEINPSAPNPFFVAGDVGIAGKLSVSFINTPFGSLSDGDLFPILTFGGDIGGVNLSDPLHPTVDLTKNPLFTSFVFSPPGVALGLAPDLVLLPQFTSSAVYVAVRSITGFVGPDFNGDNTVDFADLDIWKANAGIISGATVLQGDANGDGAVNALDFFIWLDQLGGPPMPGAGGVGSVPEPASLAMLSLAGVMALAFWRRRA